MILYENLNINDYKSADYFKLPKNIQNIITNNNIFIPSNVNPVSGVFNFSMNDAYIKQKNGTPIKINTLPDYKPIFIDFDLPNMNTFKFNRIDAIKYKNTNNINEMINFDTSTSKYIYPT